MFGRKLRAADGEEVEVLDPGRLNTDAGPDFFNSKIRVGGTEWAGNVEIHVKASDWQRHGHDADPAYDNIILHVVAVSDKRIKRRDGSLIPQVEVVMPEDFFRTYSSLSSSPSEIRCLQDLNSLSPLTVTDWFESLAVERMQAKAKKVEDTYRSTGNDWERACFIMLARSLGFGLNGDPFELMARSIPLRILHHHSDNPLQLEALLFGQAAMLDPTFHIFDEYYQLLCREYYFLARKYGLRPMRAGLWKYSRTRPQNFPHRRIATLAKACEGGFSLFSSILETRKDSEAMKNLFNWKLDGYWHDHFSFDMPAQSTSDTLSDASRTSVLINAAVPLLYAYSAMRGDMELGESCVNLLSSLPPENNAVTRQWVSGGLASTDALRSQALIHLKKEYCDTRKCLYCRFGHHLLRRAASCHSG